MSTILLTIGLTVVVVATVLAILLWVRTPYYRFDASQLRRILNLVLDDQAQVQDWALLMAVPIRHDPALRQLRQRCREIAATELVDSERIQFTAAGRQRLQALLCELDTLEEP